MTTSDAWNNQLVTGLFIGGIILLLLGNVHYRSVLNVNNNNSYLSVIYYSEFQLDEKHLKKSHSPNIKSYEDSLYQIKHVKYEKPQYALKSDPYIPSYYKSHYGLYYDSFNQPLNAMTTTTLKVGSIYSAFTTLLNEDDNEIHSEYGESIPHWKERFEKVKDEVFKAFQINNEQKQPSKPESLYSTVYFWEDEQTNSGVLYGHNICYSPSTAEIFLFFPHGVQLDPSVLGENFRWGWTIRQYPSPLYSSRKHSQSGTVINHPPFRNHIYHALEGMGFLLHKLFSAEDLPFTAEVINSGLSETDYLWIRKITSILMESYPLPHRPKLYTLDTVSRHPGYANNQICFDEVVILDRMRQAGDGGFLSGFLGTDWVRSLVYKKYGLEPQPTNSTQYQLLFVQRTNSRRWVNPHMYLKHIKKRFHKRLQVVNYQLSSTPLRDQVEAFLHAQIVLSPHGAGLTNTLFMMPHSVVIEVTPPHFTEFCLANVILHARLHYIYVPNFDYSELRDKNIAFPDDAYNKGEYSPIRSRYKSLDLSTSYFAILSSIEDAIEYLDHYQTRRINDDLSPIFM